MFKLKSIAASMALIGSMGLATSAQAVLLVDNFNVTEINVSDSSIAGSTTGATQVLVEPAGDTAIASNARTVTATALSSGVGTTDVHIDQLGLTNFLEINNSSASHGTVGIVYAFASAQDFAAAGTAILLDVLFVDTGVEVEMVAGSSSGTSTTGYVAFDSTPPFPKTFFRTFASFSGSADFSALTSLTLNFRGGNAWDGQFDFLRTDNPPPPGGAPEIDAASGTGALTLLGGMLALMGERRRRSSKA
jgi:hypothetical protein